MTHSRASLHVPSGYNWIFSIYSICCIAVYNPLPTHKESWIRAPNQTRAFWRSPINACGRKALHHIYFKSFLNSPGSHAVMNNIFQRVERVCYARSRTAAGRRAHIQYKKISYISCLGEWSKKITKTRRHISLSGGLAWMKGITIARSIARKPLEPAVHPIRNVFLCVCRRHSLQTSFALSCFQLNISTWPSSVCKWWFWWNYNGIWEACVQCLITNPSNQMWTWSRIKFKTFCPGARGWNLCFWKQYVSTMGKFILNYTYAKKYWWK